MTTVIAKSKSVDASPRKVRLIAQAVKTLPLNVALDQLKAMPGLSAEPIEKTIKQAVANASHNLHLEPKGLILKNILVDEGRSLKRMDKSHGSRFDRGIIHKKTAHITVVLETLEKSPTQVKTQTKNDQPRKELVK